MTYSFSVRPRFTPGSPAQVPEHVALRVAIDERRAHADAARGAHGAVEQVLARAPFALDGIVEMLVEYSDGWLVVDLITGEAFYRFANRHKLPTPTQRAKARERLWKAQLIGLAPTQLATRGLR